MSNVFDSIPASAPAPAMVPTPPPRPVNVFDTVPADPPTPRPSPRNVFDAIPPDSAAAAVPPGGGVPSGPVGAPQRDPEKGKGFWNALRASAERERLSPSAASSLDLLGVPLGTMDKRKFAEEQAAMQRNLKSLPPVDPAVEEWSAEYFGNLIGGIPSQLAEGVVYGVGGAAAGAGVGAAGGPVGAVGGALTGFGAGAGLQDMSRTFMERLQQQGVDVTNPDDLEKALNDPAQFEPAFWYAARRAGAVGILSALTGKVGNTVAASTFKPAVAGGSRTVLQKTGVGAVGAGVGAVGGAMQETGGQLAGGGTIDDPGAILDEAIAGVITEAPAIAAPSVIAGVRAVTGPRATSRQPGGEQRPPPLGAVFDPATGQVQLTDNVFDLDMSDPEVVAAAGMAQDAIEHTRAINNDVQSAADWLNVLDLDSYQNTQIGKRLLYRLRRQFQSDQNNGRPTPFMLDQILETISAPLARVKKGDPNAPMPPSMVESLWAEMPDGTRFEMKLSEGRDLEGNNVLVVEPGVPIGLEVEPLVQRALDDGYDALVFTEGDPRILEVAAHIRRLGGYGMPDDAKVDVLFGTRNEMRRIKIPDFLRGAKPLTTATVAPSYPQGWGSVPGADLKMQQYLPQKMTDDDINATLKRMFGVAQQFVDQFRLSKKIVFGRSDQTNAWGWAYYHGKDGLKTQYDIEVVPKNFRNINDMWATIMHEVGHIVMFDRLQRADLKTQLAILSDYATWKAGVAQEQRLQRQHRQITPSRETTTGILNQFESINRAGVLRGDAGYNAYWTSYTEWFAQQVARWATTQERPLTVVDRFFKSLGSQLRRLLERLYRATGLRFEPSRAVNTYLDKFLEEMTPEVFGSVYDNIERKTRAANTRALKAMGAEYVEAFPQGPETAPSREVILKLFGREENATHRRGVKKSIRELEGLAAMADRISKIREWGLSIYQLAEDNLHIRGLQLYKETLSLAENFKVSKFINPAIQTAQKHAKLKNLDAYHNATDDYVQMRYLSPVEAKKGVTRLPTDAELEAIFAKHGFDDHARAVFMQERQDYANFLNELEALQKAKIEKDMRRPGGAVDLAAAAKALAELDAKMALLREKPYAPQMRFGKWVTTVWAFDKNRQRSRLHVYMDESEKAQRATARELAQLFPQPAFEVATSVLAEDTFPMMGLPQPLLELVAKEVDLSPTQKEFLRDLAYAQSPGQSFTHRLQRRKNIGGYSKDYTRAYAAYFMHAANWMARAKYGDELRGYAKQVQEEARIMPDEGEGPSRGNNRARIGNFMANHFQHWLDPKPDFWRLKAASFFVAMGFNPISAFINLSSIVTGSYPILGAAFGDRAAMSALGRAGGQFARSFREAKTEASAAKQRMRQKLIEEGIIDESFSANLAGVAEGRNLLARFPGYDQRFAQNAANRASQGIHWMSEKGSWLFSTTEKGIRYVTADAAFDLAMQYPQANYVKEAIASNTEQFQRLIREGWNPVEAAATIVAGRVVQSSQGIYSRWARPRFMRGKAGTLFQFKAFLQNQLWILWNNKNAATRSMLALGLMGGMMAQPGMEDISDILKALAYRLFGKDFDLEREARQLIVDYADIDPDWIMHGTASHGFGLPGLMSVAGDLTGFEFLQKMPNIDLSGRVSMGQISPVPLSVLQPTTDVNASIARATERASGAAFGLGFAVYKTLTDVREQDNWLRLVPAAFRNMPKAFHALQTGRLEGPDGRAILTFDVRDTEQMLEVLSFGIGANPTRLTQEWAADREVREVTEFWYLRQQILLRQLAEAVRTGDKTEVDLVVEGIKHFNQTLPKPFRSKAITAQMAQQSVRARERGRILYERNIPARRADRPIAEDVRRLYVQDPAVESVRGVTVGR